MAEHQFPGVFIEEGAGPKPIDGVDTSTAAMVGVTRYGPDAPKLVTSFAEFVSNFGDLVPEPASEIRDKWSLDTEDGGQWWLFALSVKGFFDNGGRRVCIRRVACDDLNLLTPNNFVAAMDSLLDFSDAGLCLAPGMWSNQIQRALIDRCETHRDCFAILDPPPQLDITGIREFRRRYNTSFAALYFPWLRIDENQVAPSGHIAGIYARVDIDRGLHKAPANEEIRGITRIEREINKHEQELLNPEGINALRFFPERGNLVWGARTLSPDPEWKYVNVRRFITYLERSIDMGTQWTVFEPNTEHLWANVRQEISDFLVDIWRAGALQGNKPEQAFFVKCDRTTMTQDDIDNGRLICLVGVAVVKPAEFIIFRIGQWTAEHQG